MLTETIRYVSDLTDQWFALIEPLLPPARRLERPRQTSLRAVFTRFSIFSRLESLPATPATIGMRTEAGR